MSDRYKIYPELNFGVARLEPEVKTFDDLYKLAKVFREDADFSKVLYQLNDMRNCSFDFDISKLSGIESIIDEYQSIDNQKIGVYLVDNPKTTAYVQFFTNSLKYKREYCSTVEKAFDLFKLKISIEEFKKLIDI